MSGTTGHLIQQQIVELTTPTRAQACALQEELLGLQDRRLAPLLDEMFSKVAGPDEVVRLNRVVLDLGVVSGAGFADAVVAGVRDRLGTILDRKVGNLRAGVARPDGRTGSVRSPDTADREILRHYLATGRLPWWCGPAAAVDLPAILARQLARAPQRLAAGLRAGPSVVTARRLAWQFPADLIVRILQLLAPAAAADVETVRIDWSSLLAIIGQRPAAEAASVAFGNTSAETEIAVLFRLLNRCLEPGAPAPDGPDLLAHLARDPALTGSAPGLTAELAAAATTHLPASSPVRRWLLRHQAAALSETVGNNRPDSGTPRTTAAAPVPEGDARPVPGRRSPLGPITAAPLPPVPVLQGAESPLPERLPINETDPAPAEHHYVTNAGLILLWPFLAQFFSVLELVRDKEFVSPAACRRAVLMLQHLVTGESEWPEPHLLLNKVLCGWPVAAPVPRRLELTRAETAAADELLTAVIGHWTRLGHTSVAGLRTSFLQRDGRLIVAKSAWQLKVARTGYDILLDAVPWGWSLVRMPWMDKPLETEW